MPAGYFALVDVIHHLLLNAMCNKHSRLSFNTQKAIGRQYQYHKDVHHVAAW